MKLNPHYSELEVFVSIMDCTNVCDCSQSGIQYAQWIASDNVQCFRCGCNLFSVDLEASVQPVQVHLQYILSVDTVNGYFDVNFECCCGLAVFAINCWRAFPCPYCYTVDANYQNMITLDCENLCVAQHRVWEMWHTREPRTYTMVKWPAMD
ncbi:hypothetical protein MIR68_012068 [Amoeboaphelidium protococcarum]|nr:hypothetical protein MIR68_012068 [Amoeboaphelidium protococcarum]